MLLERKIRSMMTFCTLSVAQRVYGRKGNKKYKSEVCVLYGHTLICAAWTITLIKIKMADGRRTTKQSVL